MPMRTIILRQSIALIIWMRQKTIMKLVVLLVSGKWGVLLTVATHQSNDLSVELILNGGHSSWSTAVYILTSKFSVKIDGP